MLYRLSYSHRRHAYTDNDYSNCGGIAARGRAYVVGLSRNNMEKEIRVKTTYGHEGCFVSRISFVILRVLGGKGFRKLAANSVYPLPTPTYWNPMARSRDESSRFLVSMMIGRFTKWRILVKSRVRNSGQPVATMSASTPSATPYADSQYFTMPFSCRRASGIATGS